MSLQKPIRKRDEAYLAWIRQQPCLFTGALAQDGYVMVEAHHIRATGHGGIGTKPDQDYPFDARTGYAIISYGSIKIACCV